MENLWHKAHQFIIDSKVGDFYLKGDEKVSVIKRSAKRIHFSDGRVVTITKSKTYGFEYFVGKNVNQILRDIEGYFVYLIHVH